MADRNSPQKHVWRARIVLLSADGLGTHAITREAGVSKTAVWHWQERFSREGLSPTWEAGTVKPATRSSRSLPVHPRGSGTTL
uniref:helix-turn-helix domain-containing protein n=1 Tax=Methylobacterium sp. B34 TaxID=95563 RepID=UPI0035E3CDDF